MTTIKQPDGGMGPGRSAGQPPAPALVRLGARVRGSRGERLGHLDDVGLELGGQRVTMLGTKRCLYPAQALVEVTARGEVVLDPRLRAPVRVDREIGRRSRAWSADGVDLRIVALELSLGDRRILHVLVRRHRTDRPRVLPWSVALVEGGGVSLATFWRPAPPSSDTEARTGTAELARSR